MFLKSVSRHMHNNRLANQKAKSLCVCVALHHKATQQTYATTLQHTTNCSLMKAKKTSLETANMNLPESDQMSVNEPYSVLAFPSRSQTEITNAVEKAIHPLNTESVLVLFGVVVLSGVESHRLVWHVLPVFVWVFSGYSGFLPQSGVQSVG